jgi:hypothetical protein
MPSPKPLPSLEVLRQAISYDPDTGTMVWRVDLPNRVRAGSPAGSLSRRGYIRVRIGSRSLAAHRIAWYLHHGIDPGELEVDHINRDPSDNRISNLRLVDGKANRANSRRADRPIEVTFPDGSSCRLPSVWATARFLGWPRTSLQRYLQSTRQHPSGIRVAYV